MCVLITGGAGFIGSHTAKLLARSGTDFVVLDNLCTGRRNDVKEASLMEGNVADSALVRRILRDHRVTAVLHLAASAQVADSLLRPDLYFANNTQATAVLLDAMLAEGVKQFVFASSCSVYGNCDTAAAGEADPVAPVSPYGESKLASERTLPWYEQAFGLRWAALRYFNAAGAEEGLGEDVTESRRIIPRAVNAALHQGSALQVFGTDFATPDGSAVRDFVHVADVARANLLALRYVEQNKPGAVVNIGSGIGVSVLDIIAEVAEQTGRPVPWHPRPARTGDPAQAISNPARATDLLHWSPTCSGLAEIVESVLDSRTGVRRVTAGARQAAPIAKSPSLPAATINAASAVSP
jgi:UDP-glucose-4-epimerase GalE